MVIFHSYVSLPEGKTQFFRWAHTWVTSWEGLSKFAGEHRATSQASHTSPLTKYDISQLLETN